MIRRLRVRFIVILMSFIATTLLVAFSIFVAVNYQEQKRMVTNELDIASRRVEDDKGDRPFSDFIPDMYAFAVLLDKDGNVTKSYNTQNIEDSVLQAFIDNALKMGNSFGNRLDDYKMFCSMRITPAGIVLSFVDATNFDNSVNSMIWTTILIYILLLIVFFIISFFLSNILTRTVEESWNKQKQFIQDASHDLKTPITVILANNDIMLSKPDATIQEEKEWLHSTEVEARKMKSLVEKMLEEAKTERLKEVIILENVNLSDLTLSLALEFEAVAFEKKIEIETDVKEDLIVKSNQDAYNRLLTILIDNALKYSYEGNKVKISLEEDKHHVILKVNNNGDVISEENLKHLFERFYRVDSSRNSDGYGLGLSIAKNLSNALKGDLSCKSNSEEGTTFTLKLQK